MRRQTVSLQAFSRAMLTRDPGFAERVTRYDAAHGPADPAVLAVLAQSLYLCWYNVAVRENLLAACRAIGLLQPTTLIYHGQITSDRWVALHGYVVAARRWLGETRPVPEGVDAAKVASVISWLGARSPEKEALVDLYLTQFIGFYLMNAGFFRLEGDGVSDSDAPRFADFMPWYTRAVDGPSAGSTTYAAGDVTERIEKRSRRVRSLMGESPDTDALLKGLLSESQPVCMHRFTRYQDIKLASIGALRWRGALPPHDEMPKAGWIAFVEASRVALSAWAAGTPARGNLANESALAPGADQIALAPGADQLASALGADQLASALGARTSSRVAIVRDFLLSPYRGSDASWRWLGDHVRQMDAPTARDVFGPGAG